MMRFFYDKYFEKYTYLTCTVWPDYDAFCFYFNIAVGGLTSTDDADDAEDSDLYTIIGAASAVLLVLILSILILAWFRRRKFDASVITFKP